LTRARLADGTLIGVANYTGSAARSEFASFARYGWCRSQNQYAWAVRLVLLTDLRGLPLGYTLVPRQRKGSTSHSQNCSSTSAAARSPTEAYGDAPTATGSPPAT
jgi:hypothetical protein